MSAHALAEDGAHAWEGATAETVQVWRLRFNSMRWLSGVYLPRIYGTKAEPPPDDPVDATSAERKRELRRQILKELADMASPTPLTIDKEGQEG